MVGITGNVQRRKKVFRKNVGNFKKEQKNIAAQGFQKKRLQTQKLILLRKQRTEFAINQNKIGGSITKVLR